MTTYCSRSILFASALAGALALSAGALAPSAAAQARDIRSIRPAVMLLVDTSGSMEYEAGQPTFVMPQCGGTPATSERSRWATVLEALTGSWSSFSCTAVNRRTAYPGQPDASYALVHNRPTLAGQSTDGVLDSYVDRIKFGLMTYDNVFGLTTVDSALMVPQTIFTARLGESATAPGDFSYGTPRALTFPGCSTTFMVDGGARGPGAPAGALVSVGNDATDYRLTNAIIQNNLLNMRPFGATPTAALLDDFRYYLNTHPDVAPAAAGGDPLAACRARYAILLTDGQPSDPYRDSMGCGTAGYTCPYDRPATIAADLCRYNAASRECTGIIDGLFVVGFDVGDPTAQALLNDLADRGGTGTARIASDRASLIAALSAALDRAAPGTTTRTAPAFAQSSTTASGTGPGTQYQFNTGFVVGTDTQPLWSGVLDRTRYVCDATNTPQRQPLDPTIDSFHTILNNRNVVATPRRLLTVVTPAANQMAGVVLGDGDSIAPLGAGGGGTGGPPPGRGGGGARGGSGSTPPVPTTVRDEALETFDLSNVNLTPAHFGITTGSAAARTAQRDAIINWVHGRPGTARDRNRFGDIYHSSPVTVGPPRSDIADEWFNLFRRRADVANRPTVVYVATNDGILHAFAAEQWRDVRTGRTYAAGEEIWGFLPPAVIPRLAAATSSHQILLDGTPVVQDVFFRRTPGEQPTASPTEADSYRTVLILGARGGGPYYIALDVTDPINPVYLWQYTAQFMGATYARATVGQVLVRLGGVLQERAVVLLPGGGGEPDVAEATRTGPVGCPAQGIGTPPANDGVTNARSRQRCWARMGRSLDWVDVVTGERIFGFDDRVFNAPLTGAASFFTGDTGTLATRAFLTDDDGVIWRIDFSNPDPSRWTAEPFHDIFHDAPTAEWTLGQPAYEPPILTTDSNGDLVLIQSTGNVDQLDTNVRNRVVSITEYIDPSRAIGFRATVNWEIWLRPGEQVTGPLDLYNGTVYFGSFESSSSSDACSLGQSRIWGIGYRQGGGVAPAGYTPTLPTLAARFPQPGLESMPGTGTFDLHFVGPYLDQIVMGVQVAQQVTCTTGSDTIDPYIGQRYNITGTGGGGFQLVAQVSGGTGPAMPGTTSVRTITRSLPAPNAYTRALSWLPETH